jgi:Ala-tRNA(Pro) deacylase
MKHDETSAALWWIACRSVGMNTLQRCQKYLKQHGVRFSHSIHSPAYSARETASADHIPTHDLAKVVVYVGDTGYGMIVLSADYIADLKEVRRLLGLTDVRLATESELAELFPDCEVGAMPPFGNLFRMPVLMDESIATGEFIAFNAGTHRDAIHMSISDFHNLVNPLVAAFAVRAPAVEADS